MAVENNECIIATTYRSDLIKEIKRWASRLDPDKRSLIVFVPGLFENRETVFLAPDGSKKGWGHDQTIQDLRDELIRLIKTFNYEDGSNPFRWVECGYGDYGQAILRGNCKNLLSEENYYGSDQINSTTNRSAEKQQDKS